LKSAHSCKFKYTVFPSSKNIQTLQGASFEHNEQPQLGQLQIPNREFTKNLVNSNHVGKNLVNSLKISLDLIITKVNLDGHACMQDLGVPIQVSKDLV
jgi:hypothetical protein